MNYWRGEYIVYRRGDEADIYAWDAACGCYRWLGDYGSTDEAERYVREMEELPPFPAICPITATVLSIAAPLYASRHASSPRDASPHATTQRHTTQRNASK